jgi:signal transduction histidine kinase
MGKDYNVPDYIIKNLMAAMVPAVNYESLASNIVNVFRELFRARLCTLWRRVKVDSEDRLILSASLGFEPKPGQAIPTYVLPLDDDIPNEQIEGVTAWIAIRRQICLANSYRELRNDPTKPWHGAHRGTWDNYQFEGQAPERFQCLLGLPIVHDRASEENEELIGVLKLESKPGGFGPEDKELAQHLIPFVAIALQTMAVREQHEQKRQRVLRDLTRALLSADPTTFYELLVKETAELLRADKCSLWLVDEERSKLKLGANFGVIMMDRPPEYLLKWDAEDDHDIDGLTPWVVIRNRVFFGERHEDLSAHPAWRGKWDQEQWDGDAPSTFGCLYAVPLRDIEDKPFGVLKIENRAGKGKFDAVDRATFDLMADFIALAIELNSRLRSDVVYEFFHLLKQPIANAVMAFGALRDELSQPTPRPERMGSRLEMLARNLDSVRVWITNVYGLAAPGQVPIEEPAGITVLDLLSNGSREMQKLFPRFDCNLEAVEDVTLMLTPLQKKKVDAILFNVMDNSFKYSDEPRDIRAEARCEDKGICLTISDNGKGIAPEDLSRIFDPYFSRGMEKWPSSMGLGLSTVERLLKELGWGREVTSQVGKGTQFHITIPREFVK